MGVKLYEELILMDRSNTANWLMFFWLPKASETCFEKACSFKKYDEVANVLNSLIHYYCLYSCSLYIVLAGRMNRRD
jgi:hypothetical protein